MNRFALKREEYVKGIITALTEIVLTIKNLNAAHFYDANTVAEDFFCGFLNKLYGYSLHNMNNIQTNYPGIDLGSKKDGIAVQVTADGKRPKIAYTIRTFINNEYYNDYSRLIVVIIGNKPRYTKPFDTGGLFSFDHAKDVLDVNDLINEVKSIKDTDIIADIYYYIATETGKIDSLDAFLAGIEKTKATVEARCRSKLKSIGVPENRIAGIIEKDIDKDKYNYIVESNKSYLIGEYGIGKSHALYILYLKKYREFIENKTFKIPCFTTAREVIESGGIQKWVNEEILANYDLLIFVDALDEVEYASSIELIEEIEYINERFKKVQIIVASRRLSSINEANIIQMKTMNDNEIDELFSSVTGLESRVSFYRNHSSKRMDYWKMLDRPFFLLIYALYVNNKEFVIKNDIDIVALFIDKMLQKHNLAKTNAYENLLQLAILSINKNLSSIHRSEMDFDPDEIVKTGLVTAEHHSFYSFPFPIVAQWLAAEALRKGLVNHDDIVGNRRILLKWRYPLSILFSISSFDGSKALFSEIVSKYPGVAGIIINEGIKSERQIQLEDSYTCGEKLQFCMNAWIDGLGKTAELLLLSDDGRSPNTLFVNSKDSRLRYSWSAYKLQDSIVVNEPQLGTNGFFYRVDKTPAAQATWPWIVSFDAIRDRLKQWIEKKRIPVHGQIKKELIWKLALKNKHLGLLFCDGIKIADLLGFNPPREVIENLVYEQKVYYKGLNELEASGEKMLYPPYPVADLDMSKGGWIWSVFSKSQMLKRIQFEYELGLAEYSYIVETFFPTIKNEMALYAAFPARIVGQLEFKNPSDDKTWSSHPVISWYVLPLPKGEKNSVQISYDNKVDLDDSSIWNDITNSRNKWRAENTEFVWSSIHSGICLESTPTPVTDWVYDKLKKDLKAICWIER